LNAPQKTVVDLISIAVGKLVATKHLYQYIEMDADEITKSHHDNTRQNAMAAGLNPPRFSPWKPLPLQIKYDHPANEFPPIKARLFCGRCAQKEPHVNSGKVDRYGPVEELADLPHWEAAFDFRITFVCLGCNANLTSFLIRKTGRRLMLCGRSPIEDVQIPKDVPKSVAKYLKLARVAYNSGATLAAIMYLRTLIEQWLKALGYPGHPSHRAADALEWYMLTLPVSFKGTFPSLSDGYSKLSDALHTATEDKQLFELWATNLEQHFEARRVNNIPEPKVDLKE
jgi:hypothetical protein